MERIQFFDYMRVAKRMQVPKGILGELKREVRKEFPKDRMLFELHMLRAIQSGYWRTDKLRLH